MNYFVSNDSTLTNISSITLFDSLSPVIISACSSPTSFLVSCKPAVDLHEVMFMGKGCIKSFLKPVHQLRDTTTVPITLLACSLIIMIIIIVTVTIIIIIIKNQS